MKDFNEYGIIIYDEVEGQGYMFYVDDELNYLNNSKNQFTDIEKGKIEELLKEYSTELNKMYDLAKSEWDI